MLEVVTVSVRRMGSGLLFSSTFVACFIRLGIARWIPNIFCQFSASGRVSSCWVIVVVKFVEGLRKGTLLMHFGNESREPS